MSGDFLIILYSSSVLDGTAVNKVTGQGMEYRALGSGNLEGFQTCSVVQLQSYPMDISSGVPRGAFGASTTPPEIPKALHNRAK